MKQRQRMLFAAAILVALVTVGTLWPQAWVGPAQAGLHGAALWSGASPLTARIDGHVHVLPPEAARCINCHSGTAEVSASAAPVLTARHLREPKVRRGGPPSRYDAAAFCTLLRTGVDPASVLLPRHMPRYEITDADCHALWLHLARMPA